MNPPVLELHDLQIGFRGRRGSCPIAAPISASIAAGELVLLAGVNGAGKTTLLRTIAGLQAPLGGEIRLQGARQAELDARSQARRLALVLTQRPPALALRVHELVALGRSPHLSRWGRLQPADHEAVADALARAGADHLAGRDLSQLSDGERQKVMIARALAQATPLLLLDEPTAHLDLRGRRALLALMRQLAQAEGKALLLSTHELPLALPAADRLWLLDAAGQLAVLTPGSDEAQAKLAEAFGPLDELGLSSAHRQSLASS